MVINGVDCPDIPPPACGVSCGTRDQCAGARDGCNVCIDDGSGGKCGTCPEGMNYDETQNKCVCPIPGQTNPHKVCNGDKCASVNGCGLTT